MLLMSMVFDTNVCDSNGFLYISYDNDDSNDGVVVIVDVDDDDAVDDDDDDDVFFLARFFNILP